MNREGYYLLSEENKKYAKMRNDPYGRTESFYENERKSSDYLTGLAKHKTAVKYLSILFSLVIMGVLFYVILINAKNSDYYYLLFIPMILVPIFAMFLNIYVDTSVKKQINDRLDSLNV
jgi:hypothetical protein